MPMLSCDHEEVDSRMCIHVKDALNKGAHKIYIRTVDTDVIVILVSVFLNLQDNYPDTQLWVGFGTGKSFKYYFINDICEYLGREMSRALPFFHAFTGCDTTSQFFGKCKRIAWESWKSFPEVTEAFLSVMNQHFQFLKVDSTAMKLLERFTCILYDKTTPLVSVNELRQELFCKRAKMMENIPPTQVINISSILA